MKTKANYGSWMIPIALAGLAIAYVMLFFLPMQRKIDQRREELAATQDVVDRSAYLAPALVATRQQLEKTLQYNATWEEHARDAAELSALKGRINVLAKAAGIVTTRFDQHQDERYNKVRETPLVMECSGSFAQICKFLHDLEGLAQTIWVDDLRMERVGENGGNVKCEINLGVFADNSDDSDQVNRAG